MAVAARHQVDEPRSASREGLEAALERTVAVLSAVGDQLLWESFEAWCDGILPRLGGQLPTLVDNKETMMRTETLQEQVEHMIRERWLEGVLGGMRAGQLAVLCSLANHRFGTDTGDELAALLEGVQDSSELARVGTLIIDCGSGPKFLARVTASLGGRARTVPNRRGSARSPSTAAAAGFPCSRSNWPLVTDAYQMTDVLGYIRFC